ncbi:4Fe-4S dicluster domain-containing protein [bacterium]
MSKHKVCINKDFCKSCGICIAVCPANCLVFSEDFNEHGFHPVEYKGGCIGCGRCYLVCPDFAIEVISDD